MHAVVIHGVGDFRYEEVERPRPGREEMVVRVKKCGVCAADPKIYGGTAYFTTKIPIIAGHEFIGDVEELGPGAKEKFGLEIGDKAIAEQIVPCGECYYCRRGLYNLCKVHEIFGILGPDGGWAEYIKYPRKSLIWKVPSNLPDKVGIAIEPLSCAIHGVERGDIGLGDTVVVIGDGTIGLLMLQVARLKNPRKLIFVGHHDPRLKLGQDLGADICVNSKVEDVVEAVRAETDGRGCDVTLEASGHPSAIEQSVQMLRKRGRLMVFSVFAQKTSLDYSIISDIKELEIFGGHLGPYTYPLAINYLEEGLVKVDQIVTHDLPLKDFQQAIELSEKKRDNAIKVIMTP
jgi:threonine dehydrogenase-like Zn-dependent dehydrogenase